MAFLAIIVIVAGADDWALSGLVGNACIALLCGFRADGFDIRASCSGLLRKEFAKVLEAVAGVIFFALHGVWCARLNFIIAVKPPKMVNSNSFTVFINMLDNQDLYFVANEFIWSIMLIPTTSQSLLIKQHLGNGEDSLKPYFINSILFN